MEQQFRNWLIQVRGLQQASSNSYVSAIRQISEHYSQNTGGQVNIYAITDQNKISEIAHDYSQTGRYSDFGYEQHSRFRAAISRYSEFFVNAASVVNDGEIQQEQTEQEIEQTSFSYERDLQITLCAQVTELFPGYKIYGELNTGVEYSVGGRRIDVLLEHVETNDLLVVELKSGIADFRVFGQISMYIGLMKDQFPDRNITGIIVAGTIHESLKKACEITDKVSLKIYRMSLELEDV